jgi:hypothetical protein
MEKKCPFSTLKKNTKDAYASLHRKFWIQPKISLSAARDFIDDESNRQEDEVTPPVWISEKQLEYALAAYFGEKIRNHMETQKAPILIWWQQQSSIPQIITNYRQTHIAQKTLDIELMHILDHLRDDLTAYFRWYITWIFWHIENQSSELSKKRLAYYKTLCTKKKEEIRTTTGHDILYDPISRFGLWFIIVSRSWLQQLTTHFNAWKIITREELRNFHLKLNYTTQLNAQSHDLVFNHIQNTGNEIKEILRTQFKMKEWDVTSFGEQPDFVWKNLLFNLLESTPMTGVDNQIFFSESDHIGCPIIFRNDFIETFIGPILDRYLLGKKDTVFNT